LGPLYSPWFKPCAVDVDLCLLSRQPRQLGLRGRVCLVSAAKVAQHTVVVGDELAGGRVPCSEGVLSVWRGHMGGVGVLVAWRDSGPSKNVGGAAVACDGPRGGGWGGLGGWGRGWRFGGGVQLVRPNALDGSPRQPRLPPRCPPYPSPSAQRASPRPPPGSCQPCASRARACSPPPPRTPATGPPGMRRRPPTPRPRSCSRAAPPAGPACARAYIENAGITRCLSKLYPSYIQAI
jgi:hypothetical protein